MHMITNKKVPDPKARSYKYISVLHFLFLLISVKSNIHLK